MCGVWEVFQIKETRCSAHLFITSWTGGFFIFGKKKVMKFDFELRGLMRITNKFALQLLM